MSLEEELYNVIEYIAEGKYKQYLSQTDKISQGTVVLCKDYINGKYKVKIDNNYVEAYSANSDVLFGEGEEVLIVYCADNDKRIILGSSSNKDKVLAQYQDVNNEINEYNYNGTNVITSCDNFNLSSYHGVQEIIAYAEAGITNKISFNKKALESNIKNSDHLLIGASFRNELAKVQQEKGNFGIKVIASFKVSEDSTEVTQREFILDINKFLGQPYKLINYTKQYYYFPIDGKNFIKINNIIVFCEKFPNTDLTKPADIFIKDIYINNVSLVDNSSTNRLTIEGNNVFAAGSGLVDNELNLSAKLMIKGQEVKTFTSDTRFYWFVEDSSIDSLSDWYDVHGGIGWRCLNNQELPGITISKNNFSIKEALCLVPETKIKCVVEYNQMSLSSPIVTLFNPNSNLSIEVISTNGNNFSLGNGRTNLYCKVESSFSESSLIYKWSETQIDGTVKYLEDTTSLNTALSQLRQQYAIDKENAEKATADSDLVLLQAAVAADEAELALYDPDYATPGNKVYFRVNKNIIYNVYPSDIFRKITYKCAVYANSGLGQSYLGTASLDLINLMISENSGYLKIKNGNKCFKYNREGLSPAAADFEPNKLEEIDIELYDSAGTLVSENPKNIIDITWMIPKDKTFITPVAEDMETGEDWISVSGRPLNFKISAMYNASFVNNDIKVSATYNGITYSGETSFVFIKEGDIGTNGTDYVCRILPNTTDANPPKYPIITTKANGNVDLRDASLSTDDFPFDADGNRLIRIPVWVWIEDEDRFEARASSSFACNFIESEFAVISLPDSEDPSQQKPVIASLDYNHEGSPVVFDYHTTTLNYNIADTHSNIYSSNEEWLKVEVWKDGEVVYDSSLDTSANKNSKVKWRIQRPYVKNNLNGGDIKLGYSNFNYIENGHYNNIYSTVGCKFNYTPNTAELLSINLIAGDTIDTSNESYSPHNIIECIVTIDGKEYYATMPIITIHECYNSINAISNQIVEYDVNTGYHYVMYNNSGLNPNYSMSEPFTTVIKSPYKKVTNQETGAYIIDYIDVSKNTNVNFIYTECGGTYRIINDQIKFVYDNLLKEVKIPREDGRTSNQTNLIPNSEFLGDQMNNGLRVDIVLQFEDAEILNRRMGSIHIPIDMYLDRYSNQAISGWDGNSVSIDAEGSGMILAPQIGAGKKEADNSFTGMVMGTVRDVGEVYDKVGLFGYSKGERTSFISAQDGHAAFGRKGSGQILIDPRDFEDAETKVIRPGHAVLFSRNFWTSYDPNTELPDTQYIWDGTKYDGQKVEDNNYSLAIDLTDGRIVSANGKLIIDSEGIVIKNSKGINIVESGDDTLNLINNGVYKDGEIIVE